MIPDVRGSSKTPKLTGPKLVASMQKNFANVIAVTQARRCLAIFWGQPEVAGLSKGTHQ
jgi:hypothetical protein